MKKDIKIKKKLLLITSAFILIIGIAFTASSTFAKYYESAKVEGVTATIAKWGFTISVDTSKLFGDKYDKTGTVSSADDSIVVKSSGNVVAPGTSGYLTITINGSAEVASELAIKVGDEFKDIYLKTLETEDYYYPIKWRLSPKEGGNVGNATTGLAVNSLFTTWNINYQYEPGKKIESLVYKLEWEWPFEGGDNVKDTILGNFASGNQDTSIYEAVTEIIIPTISVSVTQLKSLSD